MGVVINFGLKSLSCNDLWPAFNIETLPGEELHIVSYRVALRDIFDRCDMNHWIFQHVANGLSGKASLIKDTEVVVFQQDVVTDRDEYFVWQYITCKF